MYKSIFIFTTMAHIVDAKRSKLKGTAGGEVTFLPSLSNSRSFFLLSPIAEMIAEERRQRGSRSATPLAPIRHYLASRPEAI